MARGHLRERSPGSWELKAYAGTDPDTGRKRWVYQTVKATSRRAAEKSLTELVHRVDRQRAAGQPARPGRKRTAPAPVTVRQALDAWFAWATHLEPNGRARAREWIDRYVLPKLGDVPLWRLRPDLLVEPGDPGFDPDLVSLSAYYVELMTSGGRDGRPLAAPTVRRVHAILRSGFDYAVARNWVAANPAIGARIPKVAKRPATTPEAHALTAFLAFLELENPALVALLHVMASGARRVDLALRWEEVDLDRAELVLGKRGLITGLDGDGREVTIVSDSETHKRRLRRVALDSRAVAALRAHRDAAVALAVDCGEYLRGDAYVFSPDPAGRRPYRPDWATKTYARLRARAAAAGIAGLERVRLYDVRHFMATQLLAAGCPAAVVAERMGSSERTLDHHYRHAVPARDRAAADMMDAIWRDAPELAEPAP